MGNESLFNSRPNVTNTREAFKDYCLRKLGSGVIKLEITPEQIEDRIDEAVDFFNYYDAEGIIRTIVSHRIKASHILLNADDSDKFKLGDRIIGQDSGAIGEVLQDHRPLEGPNIYFRYAETTKKLLLPGDDDNRKEFIVGETITAESSGNSSVISELTIGDYDKRYIDNIPDCIFGVNKVFAQGILSSSQNIFDISYRLKLLDLYAVQSGSINYFETTMRHISLLESRLNGEHRFEYNRREGKLYLHVTWGLDVHIGTFIALDVYRALRGEKIWDSFWLKDYCTALLKVQWGQNLRKFSSTALLGGVQVDGVAILEEGKAEVQALKEDITLKQHPVDFFVG